MDKPDIELEVDVDTPKADTPSTMRDEQAGAAARRLVELEDQLTEELLGRLEAKEAPIDVMARSILTLCLREPRLKSKVLAVAKAHSIPTSMMTSMAAQFQVKSEPAAIKGDTLWSLPETTLKRDVPKELSEAWAEGPPAVDGFRKIAKGMGLRIPPPKKEKVQTPLPDRLLNAVEAHPGLERKNIMKVIGGGASNKQVDRALGELERAGKIRPAVKKRRIRDQWYTLEAFANRAQVQAQAQAASKKKKEPEPEDTEFTIAMQKGDRSAVVAEKALLAIGLDAGHDGQLASNQVRNSIEGYLFVADYAAATDSKPEEVIELVIQSVCDRGWLAQAEDTCIITEGGLATLRKTQAPAEVLQHVDCLMDHSNREKFVRASQQQKLLTISRRADAEEMEALKAKREQLEAELGRTESALKALDGRIKTADKQLSKLALEVIRLREPKTIGKRK